MDGGEPIEKGRPDVGEENGNLLERRLHSRDEMGSGTQGLDVGGRSSVRGEEMKTVTTDRQVGGSLWTASWVALILCLKQLQGHPRRQAMGWPSVPQSMR